MSWPSTFRSLFESRVSLGLVVCGLLVFSGCTSDAPLAVMSTTTTQPQPSMQVSSAAPDTPVGRLDGQVVDVEVRPIGNASVAIPAFNTVAFTLEDGAFQFGNVPVGTHILEIHALGFESLSRAVTVVADESTTVTVQLVSLPVEEARIEVYQRVGHFECELSVIMRAGCEDVIPGSARTVKWLYTNITAGHVAVVTETQWKQDSDAWLQDFAQSIVTDSSAGSTRVVRLLDSGAGPSVLRNEYVVGRPNQHNPTPASEVPWQLLQAYSFIGRFAETQCGVNDGLCTGVGLALDLRFDDWVSVFVLEAPTDLASYSVLEDA